MLTELRHASEMQAELENLVEEGNYCKVGVYICSGFSLWYMCSSFQFHFHVKYIIFLIKWRS